MKIVIVKHENCATKYVFEVPEKEYVYAGDLVLVEVSYSDNDGDYFSELEHHIMPRLASTMVIFDHH